MSGDTDIDEEVLANQMRSEAFESVMAGVIGTAYMAYDKKITIENFRIAIKQCIDTAFAVGQHQMMSGIQTHKREHGEISDVAVVTTVDGTYRRLQLEMRDLRKMTNLISQCADKGVPIS